MALLLRGLLMVVDSRGGLMLLESGFCDFVDKLVCVVFSFSLKVNNIVNY